MSVPITAEPDILSPEPATDPWASYANGFVLVEEGIWTRGLEGLEVTFIAA